MELSLKYIGLLINICSGMSLVLIFVSTTKAVLWKPRIWRALMFICSSHEPLRQKASTTRVPNIFSPRATKLSQENPRVTILKGLKKLLTSRGKEKNFQSWLKCCMNGPQGLHVAHGLGTSLFTTMEQNLSSKRVVNTSFRYVMIQEWNYLTPTPHIICTVPKMCPFSGDSSGWVEPITWGLIISPFIQKWQLRLESSVASCYIKSKTKWVDEDIDNFQFGSFIYSLRLEVLLTAWDVSCWKKKTVVELRRNKDVEFKAGGQELKCWSPKQELKISNLFLRGSVGLEGKMNDKRMIFPDTNGP